MSDPRDFDRGSDYDRMAASRSSNAMWGWIAGIVFLVVVLALVFGTGREGTRTAGTGMAPPSTTGAGSTTPPPINPPPAR